MRTPIRDQLNGHHPWPDGYHLITPPESFVSQYVEFLQLRTDAHPLANEAAAVGILSSLVGPMVTLPIAARPNGMNLTLWLCYAAPSGTRKSTVMHQWPSRVLNETLGPGALLVRDITPQALVQKLQEREGQPTAFLRDEFPGLLQDTNRRGGHMAKLPGDLIKVYDGDPLQNVRTKKPNKATGTKEADTDFVRTPYLTILAAGVDTALAEKTRLDDVTDGWLARFVFITTPPAPHPRDLQKETDDMREAYTAMLARARRFRARCDALQFVVPTPEVFHAHGRLQERWLAHVVDHPYPTAARACLTRLAETVLKVAALLTIDLAPLTLSELGAGGPTTLSCGLEAFEPAQQLVSRWVPMTLATVATLGASQIRRDCDAVLASIKAKTTLAFADGLNSIVTGGLTKRQLHRLHRNFDSEYLTKKILVTLVDQDLITWVRQDPVERGGWPALRVLASPLSMGVATWESVVVPDPTNSRRGDEKPDLVNG